MKRPVSTFSTMVTLVVVVALAVVGSTVESTPLADAEMTAPSWGDAIDTPGLAALGGTENRLVQVACTSPGNCTAVGSYTSGSKIHPLLVEQVDGVWGNAFEVPGNWAFDPDDVERRVGTIACAPDGGCMAAGTYATGSGQRVFVIRRVGGVWTDAEPMPNGSNIGEGGSYMIRGSSCSSAGNCALIGFYITPSSRYGSYIVDLDHDVWQDAIDVPGLAALSAGGLGVLSSVSCPSDGSCSATGVYQSTEFRGFVVDQSGGVWGTATDVPGLSALAGGGNADSLVISCSSAGNCSVGGSYVVTTSQIPLISNYHPFVADRVAGSWNDAQSVTLPGADDAVITKISCPSDGNCSAIGWFHVAGDPVPEHRSLFVLQRTGGSWSTPEPMPGLAALDTANYAAIDSLSCAAPGVCAASGHYTDASGKVPFVANSTGGVWSSPIPIPGLSGRPTGQCVPGWFDETCPSGRSTWCSSPTRCVLIGNLVPDGVSSGFLADYVGSPIPDPAPPVFTG